MSWMSVSNISATSSSLRYDLEKFKLMLHGNNIALVVINMPIYSCEKYQRAAQHSRIRAFNDKIEQFVENAAVFYNNL